MIVPYRDFLYQFSDFAPNVTVAAIRKQFPEGDVRTMAFFRAKDQLTDRADLAYEYVNCRVQAALYSVDEYDECIRLVEEAMERPPRGTSHEKLSKLQKRLLADRADWILEAGLDEPKAGGRFVSDVARLLRTGRVDDAIERAEYLRANIRPRGVLYFYEDDQLQLWCAYEDVAEYYFENEMPEQAIPLMNEFSEKRIEVKLLAIPGYRLQEQIIGYLAQVDTSTAQSTLRLWLENSRSPYVSDFIAHHPDFQSICETTQYVERSG